MQFPNPIVRSLIIYDNNGNAVVIIGPGPIISIVAPQAPNYSIVLDPDTNTPTIFFHNPSTNTDAFINAPNGNSLGINDFPLTSTLPGTPIVQPRLWFQPGTPAQLTLSINRISDQVDVGGQVIVGETFSQIRVRNAAVSPSTYGYLQADTGGITMGSDLLSRTTKWSNTTGFLIASGTDGQWTDLSLKNGWGFLAGYRRAQARIDALGNVQLRGTISGGTIVDNTNIFDLPFASMTPNADILLRPAVGPTGAGSAGSSRIFNPGSASFFCYGINAGGTTDLGLDGLNYTVS